MPIYKVIYTVDAIDANQALYTIENNGKNTPWPRWMTRGTFVGFKCRKQKKKTRGRND